MRVMKAALPASQDEVYVRQEGGLEGAPGPVLNQGQRIAQALKGQRWQVQTVVWEPWEPLPGRLQTPEMHVAMWAAQGHTCPLTIPKETKRGNRSLKNEMVVF